MICIMFRNVHMAIGINLLLIMDGEYIFVFLPMWMRLHNDQKWIWQKIYVHLSFMHGGTFVLLGIVLVMSRFPNLRSSGVCWWLLIHISWTETDIFVGIRWNRMILKYLIPVKLSIGILPKYALLEKYKLLEVQPNSFSFMNFAPSLSTHYSFSTSILSSLF